MKSLLLLLLLFRASSGASELSHTKAGPKHSKEKRERKKEKGHSFLLLRALH